MVSNFHVMLLIILELANLGSALPQLSPSLLWYSVPRLLLMSLWILTQLPPGLELWPDSVFYWT